MTGFHNLEGNHINFNSFMLVINPLSPLSSLLSTLSPLPLGEIPPPSCILAPSSLSRNGAVVHRSPMTVKLYLQNPLPTLFPNPRLVWERRDGEERSWSGVNVCDEAGAGSEVEPVVIARVLVGVKVKADKDVPQRRSRVLEKIVVNSNSLMFLKLMIGLSFRDHYIWDHNLVKSQVRSIFSKDDCGMVNPNHAIIFSRQ
ncbi:hypothetical protein DVH24_027993 [Malus domestica]|uniref:Uncharacterized protein n=1 Tax=Malus domestica TaxID=3750 RepID=A0A498H8X9_MALDO|nr:hypothetical protein DVH24_027993 [Malus domestica]